MLQVVLLWTLGYMYLFQLELSSFVDMCHMGRLQSMGSLRVGHDWATSLSLFTFVHWRRKWQPTPMFLPGESQGWGSLVVAVVGSQSRTQLKWLSSSSSSNLLEVNLCSGREEIRTPLICVSYLVIFEEFVHRCSTIYSSFHHWKAATIIIRGVKVSGSSFSST